MTDKPEAMLPQLRKRLDEHGPSGWKKTRDQELIESSFASQFDKPIDIVALVADIRASTALMKEATSLAEFAKTMRGWFTSTRAVIQRTGGWFDKFTGDGIIAYWLLPPEEHEVRLANALSVATQMVDIYRKVATPRFLQYTRNYPADAGLAAGMDIGPACLAMIANDLTIIGQPVVGATRMAAAAKTGEVLCNVQLGTKLVADGIRAADGIYRAKRDTRCTKEYERQLVYVVQFEEETRPGEGR